MNENNTATELSTAELVDAPSVNVVIEGNVENVYITVNHFRDEDKEEK